MNTKRKLPTIRDVAELAGVSPTTVSCIINRKPNFNFSQSTLERVDEAIKTLGYAPNRLIKAMQTGKSCTIGIGGIRPDQATSHEQRIISGLCETIARTSTYDVLFYLSSPKSQPWNELMFLDGRTDGVVLLESLSSEISSHLARLNFPTVTLFRKSVDPGVGFAYADAFQAASLAVRHLWDRGHRRIAHLAGHSEEWEDGRDLLEGYKATMAELAGGYQPEWIFYRYSWSTAKCPEAVDTWMSLPPGSRPTAIFAANDHGAMKLAELFRTHGLRVPEDISLIGLGNFPAAASFSPRITSIDMSEELVGAAAGRAVINIAQHGDPEHNRNMVPVSLIERESVRALE